MGDRWAVRLAGVPDAGYDCRIVNPWTGHYLMSYDPDAREGIGEAVLTGGTEDAMTFDSFDEAKAYIWRQSTVMPTHFRSGVEVENRPLAVCDFTIDPI